MPIHFQHRTARLSFLGLLLGASMSALAAPLQSGEAIYQKVCIACHGSGPVDAPKLGDKAAWEPLLTEGQAVVTAHGWVGVREMPPKGGAPKLKLEEFWSRSGLYGPGSRWGMARPR